MIKFLVLGEYCGVGGIHMILNAYAKLRVFIADRVLISWNTLSNAVALHDMVT